MCAAPSGGAIWFAGDDATDGSNVISLTSCTLTANNAQYGGALYGSAGARMLVNAHLHPLCRAARDVAIHGLQMVVGQFSCQGSARDEGPCAVQKPPLDSSWWEHSHAA